VISFCGSCTSYLVSNSYHSFAYLKAHLLVVLGFTICNSSTCAYKLCMLWSTTLLLHCQPSYWAPKYSLFSFSYSYCKWTFSYLTHSSSCMCFHYWFASIWIITGLNSYKTFVYIHAFYLLLWFLDCLKNFELASSLLPPTSWLISTLTSPTRQQIIFCYILPHVWTYLLAYVDLPLLPSIHHLVYGNRV